MNSIYQKILDQISAFLPLKWEKVIIYLEYGKASYSFAFYVKNADGYVKCFDLPDINEKKLDNAFKQIDKIVSVEQKEAGWSNMTMVVNKNGKMKSDYDYTDLSGGTYQYKKNWKNKYLL